MRSLYHEAIHSFMVLFQWHQWSFSIFSYPFIELYLFNSGNNISISLENPRLTMSKPLKVMRCMSVPPSRTGGNWKRQSNVLQINIKATDRIGVESRQMSPHFSCKGSENIYLRLCGSYVLCYNYSALVLQHESSHTQYVNERVWVRSNRTLFMDTEH